MSGLSPENSAIRVTKSLEEQIAEAGSQAEVQQILRQAALDQRLVTPDIYDPGVLLPTEPGTAPRGYARAIVIDGVKHVVEAATELELEKAVGDLYRAALTLPAATERTEPARDPQGRFTAEPTPEEKAEGELQAAHQAELRLQMIRGEITPEEFLVNSGAMDRALEARGIDPEALQEVSATKVAQSWAAATQEFLVHHPDWQGGAANKDLLAQLLLENDLTNHPDKLAALEAVYDHAVENNLLIPNPEVEMHQQIGEATSPSELRAILQPPERQARVQEGLGNGLFGR
jgi:hypothetical protein